MPKEATDKVKSKLKLKRAGRKRRAAGWTLFTLGVLVAGVWVASGWWWIAYRCHVGSSGYSLGVAAGIVDYMTETDNAFPDAYGWYAEPSRLVDRRWVWWGGWESWKDPQVSWAGRGLVWSLKRIYKESQSFRISVVAWPIPLLLWTPAAPLLRSGILARRRALKGMCAKCGYSLVGLGEGAPCPECGKAARQATD